MNGVPLLEVEQVNRQTVISREKQCRLIHHFQIIRNDIVIVKGFKLTSDRIQTRIAVIYAGDTVLCHEQGITSHFDGTLNSRIV